MAQVWLVPVEPKYRCKNGETDPHEIEKLHGSPESIKHWYLVFGGGGRGSSRGLSVRRDPCAVQ